MVARAGVTLVELLIVLAILGIVATLVVPSGVASVFRTAPVDPAIAVLDSARRLAVTGGVTVRVRVRPDGQWSIAVPGAGEPLAAGALPAPLTGALRSDLTIDPLGTCRPASRSFSALADTPAVFDAGRCQWVRESQMAGALPP